MPSVPHCAVLDKKSAFDSKGFTIVELLIVVVVIAILAAITIISYNGIVARANVAVLQNDLAQASMVLETYNLQNGQYPANLATAQSAAGLKVSGNNTVVYQYNYDQKGNDFCLAELNGATLYGVTDQNKTPTVNLGCATQNGLVGWWRFNGNVNDSSSSSLNGTINGGVTYTTGPTGTANTAVAFDGSTGYISLPPSTPINFTSSQDFTVSAWVNFPTNLTSGKWDFLIGGSYGDWGTGIQDNGTPYLRITKLTQLDGPLPPSAMPLGAWHHVTIVYSAASPMVTYYLDGALQNSNTWNYSAQGAFTVSQKNIGTSINTYFQGSMDDLRVYNRALSSGEVQALYANGAQ